MIKIYTDGACRGNPGPGGWGAIIQQNGAEAILSGYEPETTNNRMELQATISALAHFPVAQNIDIYTDSQYVQKGITEWIHGWKAKNWRNSNRKPVKNKDLWQQLDQLNQMHQVQWHWVRGHSGHPENERVDQVANEAIDAHV